MVGAENELNSSSLNNFLCIFTLRWHSVHPSPPQFLPSQTVKQCFLEADWNHNSWEYHLRCSGKIHIKHETLHLCFFRTTRTMMCARRRSWANHLSQPTGSGCCGGDHARAQTRKTYVRVKTHADTSHSKYWLLSLFFYDAVILKQTG